MKNNFYYLRSGFSKGVIRLKPIEPFDELEFMYRTRSLDKTYLFEKIGGRYNYDFIIAGFSFVNLISSNVKNIMLDNKFTGWKTQKIEVYNKQLKQSTDYSGLAVTGKCGPIINELSVKKKMDPPVSFGNSYEAYLGLYFDENTWDGSDIFTPEGRHNIFVTERVKDIFLQNEVSNVSFTPISEVENMIL